MSGAAVVAMGAISGLGEGSAAFAVGPVDAVAKVAIARDEALVAAGLAKPFVARATLAREAGAPQTDHATALLARALVACATELDETRPGWRRERVGLAIGTSSGGMLSAETFFAAHAAERAVSQELARASTYFAPLHAAALPLGVDFAPAVQVLGACASSTLAVGLGLSWLRLDRCDVVLAGGYDAVSVFVAAGFEALGATSSESPRPFRLKRDGMALGEGAAVVALVANPRAGTRSYGFVAGFGASTDAVHITAPDRTGAGLARAVAHALDDARLSGSDIDLVSAHATATPFNDVAEARALRLALGETARPLVHPFKAQIGHTLGAAGLLESLAALDAMARGIAPASAGEGPLDPQCDVALLDRARPEPLRAALKLSAAFGGCNAALVLTRDAPSLAPAAVPSQERAVFLHGFASVEAPLETGELAAGFRHRPGVRVERLDDLARLALTALFTLAASTGHAALEGAGLVFGHTLATLDTNDAYDARRRQRGARHVEPRRFPATSPNAVAGECAIAFQLTGPSFGVGASLHGGLEALSVARDLVAAGACTRMVVVAADEVGPTSEALLRAAGWPNLARGATAALVSADPGAASLAPVPAITLRLDESGAELGWVELARFLARLTPPT